jgi:adenylate cyclase
VMGDNVNLASRLEGTNKVYGSEILISEFTWREVQGFVYGRELDRVRVMGKTEPVAVYEVLGMKDEPLDAATAELIERFHAALVMYRERNFEAALEALLLLAEAYPDDKATRLYIARCRSFLEAAPAAEWDGVYEMRTK